MNHKKIKFQVAYAVFIHKQSFTIGCMLYCYGDYKVLYLNLKLNFCETFQFMRVFWFWWCIVYLRLL